MLIHCKGEELELLPERAIYWPKHKMLLIADLHLGKSRHFQKAGIALSNKLESSDLSKLVDVLKSRDIKSCVVLGDFLHSYENNSTSAFLDAVSITGVKFSVVPGNHDRYLKSDSELFSSVQWLGKKHNLFPFTFMHDINDRIIGEFALAGHIHPSIRLSGFGKQSLKLPCFWVSEEYIVLPAFSKLTGTYTVQPKATDQVYVIADKKIIKAL